MAQKANRDREREEDREEKRVSGRKHTEKIDRERGKKEDN
jgi:hypothetical protein